MTNPFRGFNTSDMPSLSRRSFLQQLAAGAVAAPFITRGLMAQSPNSVVHHATFGTAGMALADVRAIAKHSTVKVVAGCEVDKKRTAEFLKLFPDARIYADYRELLEKERDLQSVNVSTPDHMHAPIGLAALDRGLHVYGQKPLTHDLFECRRLTEYAREKKAVTQMGIQIHSNTEYRTAVQLVQSGAIGKIREVHTWSSKTWGHTGAMPDHTDPVPEGLDWPLWLGVCTDRPYIKGWYHPGDWRRRLDFGTGTFGDMGCHIYDPVFKALALTAPVSVRSEGAAPNDHSWATDAVIHYVFPGTPFTEGKTVNVTWYDGGKRPPESIKGLAIPAGADPSDKTVKIPDQGSIFIGTDGVMVLPHVGKPRLVGEKVKDRPIEMVAGEDHWKQFVDAVLGKGKAGANFDYSGPLTEAVLLGSVATRFPQQTLEWNAVALKFTNVAAANKFVRCPYREGYKVPSVTA
jgi:predicted dehydrogenase